MANHKNSESSRELGWQDISAAPKDGRRIRVTNGAFKSEAWWEENLKDFIAMDSEWNLILLAHKHLTAWKPLYEIEDEK